MYSATRLISDCVERSSSTSRAISDGAPRVAVCNAMYEASRPSAKVRMLMMLALMESGESVHGGIVWMGEGGEVVFIWIAGGERKPSG